MKIAATNIFRFLTISFPLCFPFKNLMISLLWPFFYSAFYAYFTALLRLTLSFILPWYFPEKSGTFRFIFRHFFQWIYLFNLSRRVFFLNIQSVFVYLFGSLYSFYLFRYRHSFIHPHTYWFSSLSQLFELFSYSYLFVIYSLIYSLIYTLVHWWPPIVSLKK